jgi:hypothetical protein
MEFLFFNGFSTQFPNMISKALTLYSTKVSSQENSKFVEPILEVVNEKFFLHFKCYNFAIYVVNFFETFPHIILIVRSKILWLNLKNK